MNDKACPFDVGDWIQRIREHPESPELRLWGIYQVDLVDPCCDDEEVGISLAGVRVPNPGCGLGYFLYAPDGFRPIARPDPEVSRESTKTPTHIHEKA